MSEASRKTVSSMMKICHNSKDIFIQAIDQYYEKGGKSNYKDEWLDNSKFFYDYEQGINIKQLLSLLEELDTSTDSDSNLSMSGQNYFAIEEESEKKDFKRNSNNHIKIKLCLINNWEKNIENFKKQQKSYLQFITFSNSNSPYVNRTRPYSSCLPINSYCFEVNPPIHDIIENYKFDIHSNANLFKNYNSINFFQN